MKLEGKSSILVIIKLLKTLTEYFHSFIHSEQETLFIFIQRPASFSFLKKKKKPPEIRHDEMPSSVSKQLMQGLFETQQFGGFHIKL